MDAVLVGVAPLFLIVGAGVGLGRLGPVDAAGVRGVTALVYWVGMPALVFTALQQLAGGASFDGRFMLAYGLGLAAAGVAAGLGARLTAGAAPVDAAGAGMAASVGNTAFLGFPLVVTVFGDAALAPAALALLVDNGVIVPLAVAALVGAREGGDWRAGLAAGVLGAARNPTVLAALAGIGFALTGLGLPAPAARALELAAGAAAPVALLGLGAMIGVTWRARLGPHEGSPVLQDGPRAHPAGARDDAVAWRAVAWGVIGKTALAPVLVGAAMWALGVGGLALSVAIVFACAPTAVGVFVQSGVYRVYERGAAASVTATTLISLVSLSVLVGLLTR